MKSLVAERDQSKAGLAELEQKRAHFVSDMDPKEVRLYNGIRAGGRRRAVAELTHDGACGHCYGIVPLQIQNEVRHGTSLIRCEACGVILAAPVPEESEASEQAAEQE
jgi:predicted  nucleic acid-binding Zn-ribbon protein